MTSEAVGRIPKAGWAKAGRSFWKKDEMVIVTWSAISIIICCPLFFCPVHFPPEASK